MTTALISNYTKKSRQTDTTAQAQSLSQNILENLRSRFEKVEDIRILAVSTLLDP